VSDESKDNTRVLGKALLSHELVTNTVNDHRLDDALAFDEFTEQFGPLVVPEGYEPEATRTWRAALCIKKLLAQVNQAYPNRSKASDGIIGDERHCPNGKGKSDHCPNIPVNGTGVVTAIDITHDPGNGCDVDSIAEAIRESKDDRIKYMIRNGRICSSYEHKGVAPWVWRPYTGHPHDKHVHISVSSDTAVFDNENPWTITKTIPA